MVQLGLVIVCVVAIICESAFWYLQNHKVFLHSLKFRNWKMEMKVHWSLPLDFLMVVPLPVVFELEGGLGMSPHFRVRFPVYNYDLTIDDKGLCLVSNNAQKCVWWMNSPEYGTQSRERKEINVRLSEPPHLLSNRLLASFEDCYMA